MSSTTNTDWSRYRVLRWSQGHVLQWSQVLHWSQENHHVQWNHINFHVITAIHYYYYTHTHTIYIYIITHTRTSCTRMQTHAYTLVLLSQTGGEAVNTEERQSHVYHTKFAVTRAKSTQAYVPSVRCENKRRQESRLIQGHQHVNTHLAESTVCVQAQTSLHQSLLQVKSAGSAQQNRPICTARAFRFQNTALLPSPLKLSVRKTGNWFLMPGQPWRQYPDKSIQKSKQKIDDYFFNTRSIMTDTSGQVHTEEQRKDGQLVFNAQSPVTATPWPQSTGQRHQAWWPLRQAPTTASLRNGTPLAFKQALSINSAFSGVTREQTVSLVLVMLNAFFSK